MVVALFGAAESARAAPFIVPDMPATEEPALKLVAEINRSDNMREWIAPAFDLTVPLGKGLETAIAIGRAYLKEDGASTTRGWTDAEWAVKWELKPVPATGGLGVTLQPLLIVPVGSDGLSGGDWRAKLPVVLGWRQGAFTLHALVGYSASLSNEGDDIALGSLVAYDLNDRLTIGAELVANMPIENLAGYEMIADVGATFAIAEQWAIEIRVGRTIRSADDEAAANLLFAIEKTF
jgi:hypothetical protein